MRILAIAAALAIGSAFVSGPVLAQQSAPVYEPGGPQQVAGWCKTVSPGKYNPQQHGYYGRCGATSMAYAPERHDRR